MGINICGCNNNQTADNETNIVIHNKYYSLFNK